MPTRNDAAAAAAATDPALLPSDTFPRRHIGPSEAEVAEMLEVIGCESVEALLTHAMPDSIRSKAAFDLPPARTEHALLEDLHAIARRNRVMRSMIGMGYHDTITPPVILRNILENPGWYTQYTPYQAEIAQGRLEALLNFQTMIADLTGLPVANASLLDEATAAAEAMIMCRSMGPANRHGFFVAETCHPQLIEVVRGRAESLGVVVHVGPLDALDAESTEGLGLLGAILPYPDTNGAVHDLRPAIKAVQSGGGLAVVCADILALTLLESPGALGADIAIGSSQRFGVPMGFGGPHAAYMATHEKHVRKLPGRLVGISRDADGQPALRLAIQTREQHIKRDRATSNICTAQVLLAIIAGAYAVYHGPEGLKSIARRVHGLAGALALGLRRLGLELHGGEGAVFFDTLRVHVGADVELVHGRAAELGYRLRRFGDTGDIGIALDETTTRGDIAAVLRAFGDGEATEALVDELAAEAGGTLPAGLARETPILTEPVFSAHRSETQMLRYLVHLQGRDLSLANSMIPLGSCTMKLNATTEMLPVTWPQFGRLHPFAPAQDTEGYRVLFEDLERWLAELTGFRAVSLQPNAGSQGEYAGLAVIRAYHVARGDTMRDVCLIPSSAHGTNPASAIAAGFRVVPIGCDDQGNIDLDDLRSKVEFHGDDIGALMITYPSTHGVFEETVHEACALVHGCGGQVYLDGANMNAMVGIARPGEIGADVCHLNLHKTFCIPHGGGGPGMGPIGVAAHLAPYLPGHGVAAPAHATEQAIPAIAAAPYGSPSILPISWAYIALMGADGLRRATEIAILNANYMARRLGEHFDIVYKGKHGRVAHEFIVDCRGFEKSAGIRIDDIAKRLMDYGFHAPTMSWPVPGTLMIEPTESESKAELDRFCDALIAIRGEIRAIESGEADRADNVLKNAPHTIAVVAADDWSHPYRREEAAYPLPWLRTHKFWPPVGRIDNPYGDRNLVCTCS